MKQNLIVISSLFALLFVSCKNGDEKDEKDVIKNRYEITLNAIVKKDDTFQVYFKDSNDDKAPFEEKNSVRVDLKGNDLSQDIVFNLPDDRFPTYLRLDFGSNKEQLEIKVNSFKISYLDKKFVINGTQFFDYFIPEKAYLNFDKTANKVLPFVTKDGFYDPMFFSESTLNGEMIKLSK
jgi:hypothetical protein